MRRGGLRGRGSSHDVGKGVRAVSANDGKYICEMAVFIDPPWMETLKKRNNITNLPLSI